MAATAALIFALAPSKVSAASATWSAAPTDANWVATGIENNWGTVATYPGSISSLTNADTATFSAATSTITTIAINSASLDIGSITFSGTGQPAYTVGSTSGSSLFLSSGGQITDSATGSAGTATVNAPLVLEPASSTTAGTYTFNASTTSNSHVLVIGGNVSGGTTSQGITLTLTGATIPNAANHIITGNISDGGATAGLALSKTAAGTWYLSGTNTYSGGTTISAGVLDIYGASALPSTGTVNVSATGAELLLYNPTATTQTNTYSSANQSLLLNGAGTSANSGALRVDAATGGVLNATWAGATTLGSTSKITVTTGNSLNFTGNVTDGGFAFTKQGGGIVTLSGTGNNFTGTLTIGNGTLQLADASGAAVGGAAQGVSILTTGTLQMGAVNQFNATTPAPVTLTGATGSGNGATFSVNGFSQGSTTAVGVGMLTLTSGAVSNVVDFNSKAGVVAFAGLTTNGASLTINNYLNNNGTFGGADELIFDQNVTASSIVFTGYGASSETPIGGGFYEVYPLTTAVPEPSSLLGLLIVGAMGWSQRRRLVRRWPV